MKPFADKDKQIEILDGRKLGFQNKENAKKLLMRYGYYEVVNGYKTFLLKENSDTEEYKDGETFEHLIALYELDKDIRNGVMKASLEIESSLRTAIAYTLAEDFGVHHRDYLHYRNFRQGDSIWGNSSPTNERAILLNKLNALTNKNIEPFNHYRSHHGHIPPWILLKETTFGNLKHLFKLLKGPQKDKVIAICYGIEISEVTDDKKSLFKDSLSVINSFRNRAAHSGRIFNYKSNLHVLQFNQDFHTEIGITEAKYRNGLGKSDLYTLSKLLSQFENVIAKITLDFYITYSIDKHCKLYPDDMILLSKEMNFPIDELKYNQN
ncbi:TPA: Abi family protein [Streptococcus suis]|nr:Abi family protein [Streptococcus suis]HEL1953396.1 Abi family protein [Streptococcus suis]HEL2481484.1 Abi family protein [Streptococcus suis]